MRCFIMLPVARRQRVNVLVCTFTFNLSSTTALFNLFLVPYFLSQVSSFFFFMRSRALSHNVVEERSGWLPDVSVLLFPVPLEELLNLL